MSMRNRQINFAVTEAEQVMIEKAARAAGQTVSTFVRSCVIADRGLAGDPVALAVIRENVSKALSEFFQPVARRRQRA